MGNSTSTKAIYNAINDVVTETALSISNECRVNAKQTQEVELENHGFQLFGSALISQKGEFKLECALEANMISKLQNSLANAVIQQVAAKDESMFKLFGKTRAEAETYIRNNIKSKVTSDIINENIAKIDQSQSIKASNYGTQFMWNITASQEQKTFVNSVVGAMMDTDVIKAIENQVEQEGDSLSTDPFSKLLGTITTFWYVFVIIFIIIAIMIGFGTLLFGGVGIWWFTRRRSNPQTQQN